MTAFAPICSACCDRSSNASSRVCSQSCDQMVMFPPIRLCSPAPMVPTMLRERTVIPRTIPRLRTTRYPGRSNAVVMKARFNIGPPSSADPEYIGAPQPQCVRTGPGNVRIDSNRYTHASRSRRGNAREISRSSMTLSVGIRGLGRIGRNLFRVLYAREDVHIGAVSEIADPAGLEYLLRFDTVLGRFPDEVSIREGNIYSRGRQIPLVSDAGGAQTAWGELGVHTVLEATSRPRPRAELAKHLDAGAHRVISLAPPEPSDPPDIVAVMGVNDERLSSEHRVVSNASSTVHCAAPILTMLDDAFGIERALFTTVHSYTSQHRLADVPSEDKRRGRAAAENIIPQASRSPALLDDLLPNL